MRIDPDKLRHLANGVSHDAVPMGSVRDALRRAANEIERLAAVAAASEAALKAELHAMEERLDWQLGECFKLSELLRAAQNENQALQRVADAARKCSILTEFRPGDIPLHSDRQLIEALSRPVGSS